MEDLISFIVFAIFVGGSILSSIVQAKKKRKAELEEALGAPPDAVEGTSLSQEREASRPRPAPKPVTKSQGWEELKRQLEQMIGEPDLFGSEEEPEETPVAPPPQPRPGSRAFDKPLRKAPPTETEVREPYRAPHEETKSSAPMKKETWRNPFSRRGRPPVAEPARQPALKPAAASKVKTKLEPAPATLRRRSPKTKENPLALHPDPVANAIHVSEVLGRRHRNPLILPRPTYPSR